MAFYTDSALLCDVLTELFHRALATPAAANAMRRHRLTLRLVMSEPSLVLTVDGRALPPTCTCGTTAARMDLVLRMQTDVIHRVWLSEIRLRDAYGSGQIKVEGSIWRALGLTELFRQIEALYPHVLQERGLLPAA
jgi:hypothetical protein